MGGWIGSDPKKMLLSDPRGGQKATGGTSKAAQYRDTEKSGLGFNNAMAFKTQQQLYEENKPSYEEAYNVTGGKTGLEGFDRMTMGEKEKYKTGTMNIAATKTDDYSDWGKGVIKDAETATSKGLLTQREKKDEKIIDARDYSKYDWDVIRPEQARKSEKLRQKNLLKKQLAQFTYGDKPKGRPERSIGNYNSSSKGPKIGGGGGARGSGSKGPNNPNSGWSTKPRPWNSSTSAVISYQLGKDGWTPEQIKRATTGAGGSKAIATQTTLSGVYQGGR